MHRSARLPSFLVVSACVVAWLTVLQVPVSAAAPRPTAKLTLTPLFTGEAPSVTGSVGQAVRRPVRLQQRVADGWRTVGSSRSTADGRYRVSGRPLSRSGTVRVLLPRAGGRAQASSRSFRVKVRTRGARLTLPAQAVTGQRLVATAVVRPVRKGRPVLLQVRRGATWAPVRSAKQNARGRTSLTFVAPGPGRFSYRVGYRLPGKRTIVSPARALSVTVSPNRLVPSDATSRSSERAGGSPRVSADGRWVTYTAPSEDAGSSRTTGVFLTEVATGATVLVSRSRVTGRGANGSSGSPDLSADGRYVTYETQATDIVAADSTRDHDILRFDRVSGTTQKISFVAFQGAPHGDARAPSISGDGRYIAYSADGVHSVQVTNAGGGPFIYVRDTQTGQTEVARHGSTPMSAAFAPDISADGRTVTFQTTAANLPPAERSGFYEIRQWDRTALQIRRVSGAVDGGHPDGDSFEPSASADGRFVAFSSDAANLVAGDVGGVRDVFVHDVRSGVTSRVSRTPSGAGGNGSSEEPRVSDNGSLVVFASRASDLVAHDTNRVSDVFAYRIASRAVDRVSLRFDRRQTSAHSRTPSVDGSGRWVAFVSSAPGIVPGRVPRFSEVYLRDRFR